MEQAIAFWSLKTAGWLPNATDGRRNRPGTPAAIADRVPHVAFVFKNKAASRQVASSITTIEF